MRKIASVFATLMFSAFIGISQCVTNVDFNSWAEGGWAANGNWVVQGGGSQVHQTINGNPSFFYSPFALMNARISGNFRTTNGDDDYMGFVFSFLDPLGQSDNFNCWLFDWKRGSQSGALPGMSLNHANGVIPPAQYNATFWLHQNTPVFTCVQNNFGSAGWVQGFNHSFELFLTFTRAMVYVDGVLVFDQPDCYWPGRFGFYNYSQQDCYYSNFQYSLYVDFTNLTPQVCPGETAQFQFINSCVGLNFLLTQYQSVRWDYGDGTFDINTNPTINNTNASHIYSQPGTYTVTLTVTDAQGCSDTATRPIVVTSPPAISFTNGTACPGNPVNFTNNTTGTSVSWQWNFGDNDTSVQQNPTHIYAVPGSFMVTLSATDTNNCSDTLSQPLTVNQPPVAGFIATTECEGYASILTDTTTGNPVQWQWDLGDGNSSILQNNAHLYSAANTYNVTLIATNAFACSDTITQPVTVNPNPNALFNAANVCFPNSVQFNNQSTGGVVTDQWSFGDGNFDTQQNPLHAYAPAGSYTATLIVIDSNSCADTAIQQIVVNPKPLAGFTVAPVCPGFASSFFDNSSITTGIIIGYAWSFGDGNSSTQQNPQNTYPADGTYNAVLIAESDSSCFDTITQSVIVNPLPVVDFTTAPVCLNQSNAFNNTSTISSGSIAQWLWDFGDGQTETQQHPSHIFFAQGTYTIVLTATSDNSCIDSLSKTVDVFDKPFAAFTASEECKGVGTVFTDNSSIGTGTITQWNYTFGDGQNSALQNPVNLYQSEGTYTATLIATSDNGCADTALQTVIVNPLPQVSFSVADVCLGITSTFINSSSIVTGTINTWAWDFADGNVSVQSSPVNTYAAFGNYNVTLVALSDKGCADSFSVNATVFDIPVATTTSTPACYHLDNGTVEVTAVNGTPPYIYYWNTGFNTNEITNLFAGNYHVTVTDANYCTATATVTVTEPAAPLLAVSTPPAPAIKLNETIAFALSNNYNDLNASYIVSPVDGLSCIDCTLFDAQPYQTTQYNITVTDSKGCTGYGAFTIVVDEAVPLFVPNVFTPNGDGANDTWGAFSQAVKLFNMQVFNRWGEKVFETDNIGQCWDGFYQGKPMPNGVYVYTGSVVYLNNSTTKLKGSVTLMR